MSEQKPAIPAKAATPGSGASVITPPSSTTTPNGTGAEGKVTIDLKEYRDLQRAKARTLSFEKRASFQKNNPANQTANNDGGDAATTERINAADTARQAAERRALAAEVRAGVSEILSRDEFKSLPEATKNLIRKNPAMLSDADNVEEALLDIEDFCRENSIGDGQGSGSGGQGGDKGNPANHETPRTVGAGAPAENTAVELEDISKLPAHERSRAVLRNSIKKAKGAVAA